MREAYLAMPSLIISQNIVFGRQSSHDTLPHRIVRQQGVDKDDPRLFVSFRVFCYKGIERNAILDEDSAYLAICGRERCHRIGMFIDIASNQESRNHVVGCGGDCSFGELLLNRNTRRKLVLQL